MTWTSVPSDRFMFLKGEAEVNWYRSSPQVRWGSCSRCGSSMFYVADSPGHKEAPKLGHIYVSLGSLTSEIGARPVAHVSFEEHLSWIEGSEALPKYRGKSQDRIG